ncbi:MAG TPA: glycoside hydrolase family 97 catalytic domain-containing protein, partial [Tepidisphaeraceae bacterium]
MLRSMMMLAVSAVFLSAVSPCLAQTAPVTLKSPNGALEMTIATVRGGGRGAQQAAPQGDGQLSYRVSFQSKPVLEWSAMGLAIENTPVLGAAVRIESSETSSQDETWTAVAGKSSRVRNHYNSVTVNAVEISENGRRLIVEARAYDDGVAFRYSVPEQPGVKELRILNEATQFRFVKDPMTWSLISRGFQTSNEGDYHELTVRALEREFLVNVPMLLNVPGVAWVGLTEADVRDYPQMYVTAITDASALATRLAPRVESIETNAVVAPAFDAVADAKLVSVITQAPMKSPWRALLIGDAPGRLVESNLVLNLNPPSAISDTSWIKPGKSAWNWWNGTVATGVPNAGMNNDTMKYYIDFASRMGMEYMLIDAGWTARIPSAATATAPTTVRANAISSPLNRQANDLTRSNPNIDVPMLVEYGKSKNVKLWLWAHYRDMDRQMDEALAQMQKWGVAGVKLDYMDRSDQWMTNWYRTVAKKAADHKLMLNYHGGFKPDGIERTFPNVMTREGVMGAEYNKWSGRMTPKHNVTLAFTRMLAGPMDYTPGGFDNVTPEEFAFRNRAPMVMGTRAHQTALFVILESAVQCVSDHPDAYTGQKETEFLKTV